MSDPNRVVTVETFNGKTSGSVAYYAAADKRILGIFERYDAGKVDKEAVEKAVEKIAGQHRVTTDWKEKAKAPETWIAGPDAFEAWLATQPPEHIRIYGSPKVIAGIIIQSKETE